MEIALEVQYFSYYFFYRETAVNSAKIMCLQTVVMICTRTSTMYVYFRTLISHMQKNISTIYKRDNTEDTRCTKTGLYLQV